LSLGPLNLVALPPLRFPKVTFLALDAPFAFAMLIYFLSFFSSEVAYLIPIIVPTIENALVRSTLNMLDQVEPII
jgi:hypothetical protein